MLPDAEKIDAQPVGQDALVDHIADDLRVRQKPAVGAGRDIAERVQSELERWHGVVCRAPARPYRGRDMSRRCRLICDNARAFQGRQGFRHGRV